MKNYLILTAIFACCVFVACSSKTGVPVEFSKACSPDNQKKYVEVAGYLDDDGSLYCSNVGGRMNCGFTFKEKPTDAKGFGADIEQGSSANEVEKLSSGYKREDIKIHASDGSIINLADRVKLTGEMNLAPDGSVCFMEVTKIEK